MKKSKVSQILYKSRFTSRRKDGTLRIVRDNYHNAKSSWWDTQKRILKRDGNRCMGQVVINEVKQRCPNTTNLHVHHRIPLSKGGTSSDFNLITLCESCHEARHIHMKRKK